MSTFETALATVEDGLVAAIPTVAAEAVEETDGVVALALTYSFEGPPLPPILGLLTESERDALAGAEAELWDAWNPAEYDLFDAPELELELPPDVDDASETVNDDVAESGRNHEAVVAMLNRVAQRLNAYPWPTDLIVYATDLEGVDVWDNLGAALSPDRLAALRSSGRLGPS